MTNSRAGKGTIQEVVFATTWTTTSGTLGDVTGCTVTLPTSGKAIITFQICWAVNHATNSPTFAIVDGAAVQDSIAINQHASGLNNCLTLSYVTTCTGQVIKLQANVGGSSTLSVFGTTAATPTVLSVISIQ